MYRTNVVSQLMGRPCYEDATQYMADHNMTAEEFKQEFDPDTHAHQINRSDASRAQRKLMQSRDRQARRLI